MSNKSYSTNRNSFSPATTNNGRDNRILNFVKEKHQGQLDKEGRDYILHPIAVAEKVLTESEKKVALAHDLLEDTDTTIEELREVGFTEKEIEALERLNHHKGVPYMEYVEYVKENPLSREVKIADIKHNVDLERMSYLPKETRERLMKKYKPAFATLNEDKWDTIVSEVRYGEDLKNYRNDIAVLINTAFNMPANDNHGRWMADNITGGEDQDGQRYSGVGLFDGERLIGVVAYRLPDEDPSYYSHGGKYAYVSNLAVDPLYQGHGIGRQVIDRMLDDIEKRGLDGVFTQMLKWDKAPYLHEVPSNSAHTFTSIISRKELPEDSLFNENAMDFEKL